MLQDIKQYVYLHERCYVFLRKDLTLDTLGFGAGFGAAMTKKRGKGTYFKMGHRGSKWDIGGRGT